jgi:hypothetical protein
MNIAVVTGKFIEIIEGRLLVISGFLHAAKLSNIPGWPKEAPANFRANLRDEIGINLKKLNYLNSTQPRRVSDGAGSPAS